MEDALLTEIRRDKILSRAEFSAEAISDRTVSKTGISED